MFRGNWILCWRVGTVQTGLHLRFVAWKLQTLHHNSEISRARIPESPSSCLLHETLSKIPPYKRGDPMCSMIIVATTVEDVLSLNQQWLELNMTDQAQQWVEFKRVYQTQSDLNCKWLTKLNSEVSSSGMTRMYHLTIVTHQPIKYISYIHNLEMFEWLLCSNHFWVWYAVLSSNQCCSWPAISMSNH